EPFLAWAALYPPELYVRCLAQSTDHRVPQGMPPLLVLMLWAAGIHGVAARIYRRLLETPEASSPRRRVKQAAPFCPSFPLLSSPASAVAVAQIRLVFRSLQGKIQVCILPLVILVMGVLTTRGAPGQASRGLPIPLGLLLAGFALFLAMMTLEGTLLNQ